jgi:hypothetical protein
MRSTSAAVQVFNSTDRRFREQESSNPGVGSYHWEIIRNKIQSLKFTPETTTILTNQKAFHQKYYEKVMGPTADPDKEVGPGKYNPALLDTRRTFSIPKGKEKGAVTHREDRHTEQAETHVGSTIPVRAVNSHVSVFQSKARRYEFGYLESKMTGDPWRYSPGKSAKRSHMVNFSRKWV